MSSLACWEPSASCSTCNQTLVGHPKDYTMVFPPIASNILAFAAAFFSFLGSIFNAVLLAGLLLARTERARVTTPFILSVCLADFLNAIVTLPIQATRFMSRDWKLGVGPEEGYTCQLYPIILFTVQGASVLSLMCITLNQAVVLFFGDMRAIQRHRWLSTYLVTLCWLAPLACLIPSLFKAYGKVELKEYTQTCTIVALEGEGVADDPKRLLFWAFAFPSFLVIVASNVVIYLKIRGVPMNKKEATNRFILMLFLAFLAWLFSVLPFVIIDTVLDPCFQEPGFHTVAYILNWTKLVANPTIFILSNRGFLIAVQQLPQNFLQILPVCCLQRLPGRILQKQPSVPQQQPLSSGELTQDEGMSESVVGGNENRENGRPILPGPPKRQEEVRSSPGEQIQIPVEGRQN